VEAALSPKRRENLLGGHLGRVPGEGEAVGSTSLRDPGVREERQASSDAAGRSADGRRDLGVVHVRAVFRPEVRQVEGHAKPDLRQREGRHLALVFILEEVAARVLEAVGQFRSVEHDDPREVDPDEEDGDHGEGAEDPAVLVGADLRAEKPALGELDHGAGDDGPGQGGEEGDARRGHEPVEQREGDPDREVREEREQDFHRDLRDGVLRDLVHEVGRQDGAGGDQGAQEEWRRDDDGGAVAEPAADRRTSDSHSPHVVEGGLEAEQDPDGRVDQERDGDDAERPEIGLLERVGGAGQHLLGGVRQLAGEPVDEFHRHAQARADAHDERDERQETDQRHVGERGCPHRDAILEHSADGEKQGAEEVECGPGRSAAALEVVGPDVAGEVVPDPSKPLHGVTLPI
jgi:hypothetical protein